MGRAFETCLELLRSLKNSRDNYWLGLRVCMWDLSVLEQAPRENRPTSAEA